jgi:hypothetical protein
MNKKYELVLTDSIAIGDKKLYRIKSLVAIGLFVLPNELGGYVEKESNLSISGDAWYWV